jgi:hypothetical protein
MRVKIVMKYVIQNHIKSNFVLNIAIMNTIHLRGGKYE